MLDENITFTILLIENDQEVVDQIRSLLERTFLQEYPMLHLDMKIAQDEDSAMESAETLNPDIILATFADSVIRHVETIEKIHRLNVNVPLLILLNSAFEEYIDTLFSVNITNYTMQPINEKFFIAQVKLFVNLYLRRQHIYNHKALNLFSKNIYRRRTEFLIEEEDDIVEFWEFVLETLFNKYKIEKVLHFIYDIELYMVKKGYINTIILEEDHEKFYLTLSAMDRVEDEILSSMILRKQLDISKYKSNNYFISLIIEKEEHQKRLLTDSIIKEAIYKDIRRSVHEEISVEEFLEELDDQYSEDVEDIFEYLKELSVLIYTLESSTLKESIPTLHAIITYFTRIDEKIQKIGLSGTLHRSFENLLVFLHNVNVTLLETQKECILLSQMLQGLVQDLKSWARILFVDKTANNVNYFDASFAENCLAIEATFSDEEIEDESDLEFFDETEVEDEDDDTLEFFDEVPTSKSVNIINEERKKDLRFTQVEKMSASELLDVLDYEVIDKVESLGEELNNLIEMIYRFEGLEGSEAVALMPDMNSVIHEIYRIVDSIGFFQVTARAFQSLEVFLATLTEEHFIDSEKKSLFVEMFLSLIQDLEKWIDVIFVQMATDDIHYFDASFSSNIMEIESVFETYESEDDDDDLEFF